jgi:hypothetical protein
VYNQNRKHRDGRLYYAARLDADAEDGMRLSEQIAEVVSTDPVAVLTRRAAMIDEAARLAYSHSQAAAYVTALRNFDDDRPRLSSYLAVSVQTFRNRMDRAFEVVNRQNSILDGFETIDDNFMPLAGRHLVSPIDVTVHVEQGELQF